MINPFFMRVGASPATTSHSSWEDLCTFNKLQYYYKTTLMNKSLGIILIAAALFFGFMGINKLDQSGGTVNLLGIKISAQDEGAKQTGYIFLGLAAICLIGGVMVMRRK